MSWQSTHATLTRNMQKSPTCTAVGQAFLFPTRTYPSQGLNLKQAAEGADNMSHRTCPIGPMAPGIKDSSPRAGGWDKNYKLATAASNAMGRAPSHPPRTAGRGRIQQRLIWKDGIKADSRPVTQSLPETYKELLIYQRHTYRFRGRSQRGKH